MGSSLFSKPPSVPEIPGITARLAGCFKTIYDIFKGKQGENNLENLLSS